MATATESTSELPPQAQAANLKTLTQAMGETKITDESKATDEPKADGEKSDKVEEGESLEDGEIREDEEEEEEDDGKPKTVFDSAKKFNLKHPLYTRWTLYFDSPQSKMLPKTPSSTPATPQIAHGGWMEDIRKVVGFDSVEEFWGLYNNIVPPSQLPGKANYYLFRKEIMPAWEDPANKNGGKWSFQVPREKSKGSIDQWWLYTMLAAIGETFETAGDSDFKIAEGLVTGVIISPRPNFYRISIWTSSAPDPAAPETDALKAKIIAIGKFFKSDVLGYDDDKRKLVAGGLTTDVTFESHKDSEKKGHKNKIIV